MATFHLRKEDTNEVISDLSASDLKAMAKSKKISANDKIRKEGKTTWHPAHTVNALGFQTNTEEPATITKQEIVHAPNSEKNVDAVAKGKKSTAKNPEAKSANNEALMTGLKIAGVVAAGLAALWIGSKIIKSGNAKNIANKVASNKLYGVNSAKDSSERDRQQQERHHRDTMRQRQQEVEAANQRQREKIQREATRRHLDGKTGY